MSVLSEIADWIREKPIWQQDALRRLLVQGSVDDAGIGELVSMVTAANGIGAARAAARPLSATDLPVSPQSTRGVTITAVSKVCDINDLARDQQLDFGASGLTVIYGDNGAGKSGYVRILKKACRARGADTPLLPNVFQMTGDLRPSALVQYAFGEVQSEFEWQPEAQTPDELSLASVFDSQTAPVYVNREQDIAYAPFGLDLLPKLAEICTRVKQLLEQARNAERTQLDKVPGQIATTTEAQWLGQLSRSTDAAAIAEHIRFSEADGEHRTQLRHVLAEPDPATRALELDERSKRYVRLEERLRKAGDKVRDLNVDELRSAYTALRTLIATTASVRAALPEELVPSADDRQFRELWGAGNSVAKAHGHNGLTSADTCPLCHQALNEAVRTRFARLSEYFVSLVGAGVETARASFAERRIRVEAFGASVVSEEEVIADLGISHPSLAESVSAYVAKLARLSGDLGAVSEEREFPECELPPRFDPLPLTSVIDALQIEAAELRAAADPDKKAVLQAEALELDAREWMHEHKAEIEEEIARLDRVYRFTRCISETDTRGVTRTATELTRRYVTDELREAFIGELGAISGDPARVELVGRPGERGVGHYRLQLSNARPDAKVEGVVSEGELRAITLAAFLSELSTEESYSAVVFDDPVSSLDTRNKERVAARFVALAARRQLIVFTHDIPFVVALAEGAAAKDIAVHPRWLQRLPVGAGVVVRDVPWEAKRFNALVGSLRNGCQRAKLLSDPLAYTDAISTICGDVRKALEKAVEEVLLSDVIARFRRPIHTQNVRRLVHIDDTDVAVLERLMSKYSSLLHLQPADAPIPPPQLDEIERDVNALDEWAGSFRRKAGRN